MDQLLSVSFLLFCVSVAAILMIIRKIVEYFFPILSSLKFYRSVFLPLIPIVIGYLLAKAVDEPLLVGLAGGLLSTVIYRVLKEYLHNMKDSYEEYKRKRYERREVTEVQYGLNRDEDEDHHE
jgi:hypothetical protein